jgi:LETM1 and EF-hand domain-containing protein 1
MLRAANSYAALSRALLAGSTGIGRRTTVPRHVTALAILVPARHISTEQHRVGASAGAPPPGFNVETAKHPLPQNPAPAVSEKAAEEGATPTDVSTNAGAPADSTSTAAATSVSPDDAALAKVTTKDVAVEKAEGKKLTLWEKVKKEAHHYWDGTKLLAAEVKISWRLALKMAGGYELSRRENRQLRRTVKDLARLVPFSVFIIVPLGEAFLPLALRLFPNMLPSTYEAQKSKDKKASVLRATRTEVSSLLRQTLSTTGLPLSRDAAQKEEFVDFFRKLRRDEKPTDADVIRVCKIFRDDLTLDNLSRPQLASLTKYMSLSTLVPETLVTDNMRRYQIRHRMRQIKRDDRAISIESVDSLTVSELRSACASRGFLTHGVSPARMRALLQTWLDLRLHEGVPSTLLMLANAYMYGRFADESAAAAATSASSAEGVEAVDVSDIDSHSVMDALVSVLRQIPAELYHEIELQILDAEGAATNEQRLEVLKEQEKLIESETTDESQSSGFASPRDVENIDDEGEGEAKKEGQDGQEADKNKKQ